MSETIYTDSMGNRWKSAKVWRLFRKSEWILLNGKPTLTTRKAIPGTDRQFEILIPVDELEPANTPSEPSYNHEPTAEDFHFDVVQWLKVNCPSRLPIDNLDTRTRRAIAFARRCHAAERREAEEHKARLRNLDGWDRVTTQLEEAKGQIAELTTERDAARALNDAVLEEAKKQIAALTKELKDLRAIKAKYDLICDIIAVSNQELHDRVKADDPAQ